MPRGLVRALWALPLAMRRFAGLMLYFFFIAPLPAEQGCRELPGRRAEVQIDLIYYILDAAQASEAIAFRL